MFLCVMLMFVVCALIVFFFFSSRRRHTRCGRDWSSDVCSSDLPHGGSSGDRGRDGAGVKETAMALERNSGENGRLVRVPAGPVVLEGNLALPGGALGVVLFAHGRDRK